MILRQLVFVARHEERERADSESGQQEAWRAVVVIEKPPEVFTAC